MGQLATQNDIENLKDRINEIKISGSSGTSPYTKAELDEKFNNTVINNLTLQSDGKLKVVYKSGISQIFSIPGPDGTTVFAE